MSLLDGLKLEMKNPLAENNDEMDFVMESAFDIALEKETDKKLSEDDIEAILRGDDDIDPEDETFGEPAEEGFISRFKEKRNLKAELKLKFLSMSPEEAAKAIFDAAKSSFKFEKSSEAKKIIDDLFEQYQKNSKDDSYYKKLSVGGFPALIVIETVKDKKTNASTKQLEFLSLVHSSKDTDKLEEIAFDRDDYIDLMIKSGYKSQETATESVIDESLENLESALEALDNILSSSDVTDKSFATDLTSSDEEDDLDGGAEPAEEGWIEKHYERKLEAAKITVMADKLSRMDPIGVARKVVSAIKPILDTSPEGSKHVADVIREYQQDDPSNSSNYFVKTINSASIGIVLGVSKDDPDTKILIMMHIPVIGTGKFNKGKPVEALLNTTGMAKYILKPIQPAEVKKADDDAAATEAAIIAECEAALEALNDSDIDRAGNVTNIKAVEGNEDPDVSEEDDEDDDMSLESLLDKCMKL